MGVGSEAGDGLWRLVSDDGRRVAVQIWCAAVWHVKPCDQTVDCDAVTRSRRP